MPRIMGILNITPDSFSDGGLYFDTTSALDHMQRLMDSGAHIIDVGAESTRPGSTPISEDEEWRRLHRLVRELVKLRFYGKGCSMSIDTYKPGVARKCLELGFYAVNDVTGLKNPEMRKLVAEFNCQAVIMHQGPGTTKELRTFFKERIAECRKDGVKRITIDPGLGFGKTPEQNWEIVNNLNLLLGDYPLLIGPSRKRFSDGIKNYHTIDVLRASWDQADIIRLHEPSLIEKI